MYDCIYDYMYQFIWYIEQVIGEGSFCQVKLGVHRGTKSMVAIKIFDKSKMQTKSDLKIVRKEIQIMKKVRHPHVIQLLDLIEKKSKTFLIMEYAKS